MKQQTLPIFSAVALDIPLIRYRLARLAAQLFEACKALDADERVPSAAQRDLFTDELGPPWIGSSQFLREWREAGKL